MSARTRQLVVLQASAGLTLSERVRAVEAAVYNRNDTQLDGDRWWPVEVAEDHVIARRGQKTYRVGYTLGENGQVVFSPDSVEVQTEYVPVAASFALETDGSALRLTAAEADAEQPQGRVWDVVIIRAGLSSTTAEVEHDGSVQRLPVFFTDEYVRRLVPMVAGAPVFALDDTPTGHKTVAAEKRQDQSVGWTAEPRYEVGECRAALHLDEGSPLAEQKRLQLLSAWRRGNPRRFGLSVDSRGFGDVRLHAGRPTYFATIPAALLSTDIVLHPAAGGGFTQLVASRGPHHTEEEMNRDRLIAAIRASRPQLLEGKDLTKITVGELVALANDVELRAALSAEPAAPAVAGAATGAVDVTAIATQITAAVTEQLAQRASMVAVITASQLPAKAQTALQRLVDQPGATVESVQAAVDEQRQILAEVAQPFAHVHGLGGPAGLQGSAGGSLQVFAGVDPLDRLQAAMDRNFGLEPVLPELKNIEPIGLRAAWNLVTCGQDGDVLGTIDGRAARVMQAAGFDTTTLPDVMANTLNRRLMQDYAELDYGDQYLVSTEGTLTDFRPQTSIQLGYLGNLPSVNTDVEDYPEVNAYGQERAIWEPGERGFILNITRKHILNDDLGAVAKLPGKIARAGKRTVAEFVFHFLISNPVLSLSAGDTLTWFHASRNNLITDPLSIAALNKARLLLASQLEPSSGKKLGLPKNVQLHLYVPQELGDLARAINATEKVPGSANNDANPWYQRFGKNHEFIHEVYSWNDTTDWALTVDPKEREILEIKYLNGKKVPQIVRQASPEVGSMFTRGSMRMKAFLDFGGSPVDFRGVVKSVVANP